MTSDEDSDAFQQFLNEQKKKVDKKYVKHKDLKKIKKINNFIKNSVSESDSFSERRENFVKKSNIINKKKNKKDENYNVTKDELNLKTFEKDTKSSEYNDDERINNNSTSVFKNKKKLLSRDTINNMMFLINNDSDNNENVIKKEIKYNNKDDVKKSNILKDNNKNIKSASPLFSDDSSKENDKYIAVKKIPLKTFKNSTQIKTKLPTEDSKLKKSTIKSCTKKLETIQSVTKTSFTSSDIKNYKENNKETKVLNKTSKPSKKNIQSILIKPHRNDSESDDFDSTFSDDEFYSESDSSGSLEYLIKSTKSMSLTKNVTNAKTSLKSLNKLNFIPSLMDNIQEELRDSEAIRYRTNFKTLKEELAIKIYQIYNEQVFSNQLPRDIDIQWLPRLRKVAGKCNYYHFKITKVNSIKIKLSVKVLTDAERLLKTLVHEMCHGAVWMVDKVSDHHGPLWKAWTSKAHAGFPSVPLSSRCHSYVIHSKYEYWCLTCNKAIKRHSKSLDITKKVCGLCKGRFTLFVNQSNGQKKIYEERATLTGYQKFVKDNYKKYRSTTTSHGEVMKTLSAKYALTKDGNQLCNNLTALTIT